MKSILTSIEVPQQLSQLQKQGVAAMLSDSNRDSGGGGVPVPLPKSNDTRSPMPSLQQSRQLLAHSGNGGPVRNISEALSILPSDL